MTDLYRVRSVWSGFPGGPGVTTMYFLDTATAVDSVHTFFASIADRLPEDVDIQVESAGDVINDATGDLTGAWSTGAVTSIPGTASGSYSAPAGAVVDWLTATILDGRRLRGRTFIVPMSAGLYDGDGTPTTAMLDDLQAAATELITEQSSSFVLWHRPFAGSPAVGSRPARPAHDGGHGFITTAHVPNFTAVLRSRRD